MCIYIYTQYTYTSRLSGALSPALFCVDDCDDGNTENMSSTC